MASPLRRKLIEVALPLEAINAASAREKSIRHGHPSTLHLWWARRPLAAARAVIFSQMVDDPSSCPDLFPTVKAQEKERQRLFSIIEELVQWENTTNEDVLQKAREEIWRSWRRACAENADHPRATELFDRHKLPAFHDPFAGGGTLPLEAQRLGLEAYASDLNPVAVLINKAMIEIPPTFAGCPPVNTEWRCKPAREKELRVWRGAQGLAEDVRYYGQWMRNEAEKRIGQLYPKVEITAEMAKERPDLRLLVGQRLGVVAWLWTRTVKSPNPAFAHLDVPLTSTFLLSTKAGHGAYVEPRVESGTYRFIVRVGTPPDEEAARHGTRAGKAQDFRCLLSGVPIPRAYVRDEGKAGRLGQRLMAIVAEGSEGRIYLPPTELHETAARSPDRHPAVRSARETFLSNPTPTRAMITGGVCSAYGLSTFGHLFTARQLVALSTFSDLVDEAQELASQAAQAAGQVSRASPAAASAYADAIATYLAFCVDKMTDTNTCLCSWQTNPPRLRATFGRQALPMVWDFAEANVFGDAAGDFGRCVMSLSEVLDRQEVSAAAGMARHQDARTFVADRPSVMSTDPPYYDNIGYAELSDFFYVWLRRALKATYPDLFATVTVPKGGELVATPYRHGGQQEADAFFVEGMTQAMRRLVEQTHPAFPVTVYYAFKQSENDGADGMVSTGWETFLDALIRSGFAVGGTWPMRSELATRNTGRGANALASSIVLACRARPSGAPTVSRREFVSSLKAELPVALGILQRGNVAPVDLAQAAIGPGMAIFTRYAQVLDAAGRPMSVREALALINQALDEVLTEQEGDFDADTRWALQWFDQFGFAEGEYGFAETLSKAKNTSVGGLVEAGVVASKAGKVRLLRAKELPSDWDPTRDVRLTAWETVHHVIRVLEAGGEGAAAGLVTALGSKAEVARELAYRLYTLCERKKRAPEALSYNALVQSWPEITRLAREGGAPRPAQAGLFDRTEE